MTTTAYGKGLPQRFFGVVERAHHSEDVAGCIVASDAMEARVSRSDEHCPEETKKPSGTTGAQKDSTCCWCDRVADGDDEPAFRGMEGVRLLVVHLAPN